MPLERAIPETDARPGTTRRPILPMVENLPGHCPQPARQLAADLWEGAPATWADRLTILDHRYDVGVLCGQSGLVVLDCDVRRADVAPADQGNSIRFGDLYETRRGIDDLVREVKQLGYDPAELATYTVSTPSGGLHLYYRQNTDVPLTSHGHRQDWLIDIKASANTWVTAPPTSGYTVIRDLPAIELPRWLAEFLASINRHIPPLGGKRRTLLDRLGVETRAAAGGRVRWIQVECALIRLADQAGGWNQQIYRSAKDLFKAGFPYDATATALLAAAAPRTAKDRRDAERTIRSAWDSVARGLGR